LRPFDANGLFNSNVDTDAVRGQAIRGAGVTVLSSGLGLAIQVLATVILARLLTPLDFGLVTMVSTFSLLFMNFGLNGLTEAVLQREEMNHDLASNLFWLCTGAGLLLTFGFAASGSLMAKFYTNPHLPRVAQAMSITIFLTSASVMHLALLKRAMRFNSVSANDILGRAVSVGVSIICGWIGWGYWALVAGAVAQPLVVLVGAWYLCRWIPGAPGRVAGTESMVSFAIHTYGRFTVNYFSRNVDNLLVGWRFGADPLGFYKKAYDLFALSTAQLTAPLTNVAVSALSRFKPRSAEFRNHLIAATSVTAFVGMGLSGELTLIGTDLIRLLLGPGWEPAERIFTFFGPGIGIMIVYYIHGWIHLSIGRADRWLRWSFVEVIVTCLLFLLALPWGPVGIAMAWTASFWLLTIPAFWYAGRPIGFSVTQLLQAIWKYAAAALISGEVCAYVTRGLHLQAGASPDAAAAAERIVVTTLVFVALYLGAVILLHGGTAPLQRFARLFKRMIATKEPSAAPGVPAAAFETTTMPEAVADSSGRKPLVSILIPAFNSQDTIAGTIRAAIAQTWEPKEIIVVDDGSTDHTLEIARKFESSGVRVFTQKNQGAAAARNHAFSVCKGEYIQWLDADDLLASDKVHKQMEARGHTRNNRILYSCGFGSFMYRYYRARFIPTALWCDLPPSEWLIRKLGQNVFMQTATWLVSRELTEAAGPWDTQLLGDDDGEYFCRVLLASEGVRFVPEAKVYYRAPWVGTLSYIGQSNRKLEAHWRSMKLHIGYLRSLEDSPRARAACLKYLQTCLIYFYPERMDIVRQAEDIAIEMGGRLHPPKLKWKYTWLTQIAGWRAAKRFSLWLPRIKWRIKKSWDHTLFSLRSPSATAGFGKPPANREDSRGPAPAGPSRGQDGESIAAQISKQRP
jgi:O-antigen/teichoic acid export membrane protein/glycosyltransferase involved in cell wall biosynthesis